MTLIYACKLKQNLPDICGLWGARNFDDMTDDALEECGDFMERAYRGRTTEPTKRVRSLRSLVLDLLTRMEVLEWPARNAYLLNMRNGHKKLLYMMSQEELETLLPSLRAAEAKHRKQQQARTNLQPAEPTQARTKVTLIMNPCGLVN